MSEDQASDAAASVGPKEQARGTLTIDRESALQFALMLKSGMPPLDVMGYFVPDGDTAAVAAELKAWQRSPVVRSAILKLQGKPWQDMTLEEQIRFAIDKNYSEMAYFLYSRNYATLNGSEKAKADTCRMALEQKLAGTAGQLNPLAAFWNDIRTGKVQLGKQALTSLPA